MQRFLGDTNAVLLGAGRNYLVIISDTSPAALSSLCTWQIININTQGNCMQMGKPGNAVFGIQCTGLFFRQRL